MPVDSSQVHTKSCAKASKAKTNPPKAKKAKTTPQKQPAKAKKPAKTPTPSPEPEENSPTSPHSPFVYSPTDPQEEEYNYNRHSDPTSEPEQEENRQPEPEVPVNPDVEVWDNTAVNNFCNRNGAFVVPAEYPEA